MPRLERAFRAIIVVAVVGGGIGACATVAPVEGASTDAINSVMMTCNRPYRLTQDCSIWSGATRTIHIENFAVKVAGSESGDTILVMDAHFASRPATDPFLLNSPTHSRAVNSSFDAVRMVLDDADIPIVKVRPLRSFGNIDGYVIEVQGDGYAVLRNTTAPR